MGWPLRDQKTINEFLLWLFDTPEAFDIRPPRSWSAGRGLSKPKMLAELKMGTKRVKTRNPKIKEANSLSDIFLGHQWENRKKGTDAGLGCLDFVVSDLKLSFTAWWWKAYFTTLLLASLTETILYQPLPSNRA